MGFFDFLRNKTKETFHPNGKLKTIATYRSDKKHGKETFYHDNGVFQAECEWVNGLQNGEVISYDKNGNKVKQSFLADGNYNGTQKEWWPNGELKADRIMKNDKIVSEKEYDSNGKILIKTNKDTSSETKESKKSVKTTKKKTSSKVQKDSNNLKEVKGKLAEDAKKDSKEITDLLKKFHSIHIQRDVNNIEEQIDLLDKVIPLIEKVQIPLYETYKKNSDPDPEHGYSGCLITYTDEELTFKYHYCELLYHRGTFKAMKGDISAIKDLEQSSEIVKEEATLLNLCLAYANLAQDIGKSINCSTECVELFPNSTRAKEVQLQILEAVTNSLDK